MVLAFLRTLILYGVLIFVVRLLGKRQIGQMEPSEFVVALIAADLAAVPMQDGGIPLLSGLIPIITILGAELTLSALALKSVWFRKVLSGTPVILIENGNILQKNLRKNRLTIDELINHLRQKDILDIQSVQYAILETNGSLSVFPYPDERPATAKEAGITVPEQWYPITLISDGKLLTENLSVAGKDEAWLKKVLKKKKATVSSTWLLTVDHTDKIVFFKKEK